jgi:hypothetical protein
MLQRDFWTEFVRLSPLPYENSVFLMEPRADSAVIKAFSWSTALVLQQLYEFPAAWKTPPRVFVFGPGWRRRYCSGMDLFEASEWIPHQLPQMLGALSGINPRVRVVGQRGGKLAVTSQICTEGGPPDGAPERTEPEFKLRRMYGLLIR